MKQKALHRPLRSPCCLGCLTLALQPAPQPLINERSTSHPPAVGGTGSRKSVALGPEVEGGGADSDVAAD